jgi:hypothetical protein
MAKVLGPLHSDRVKGSVSGQTFREYRGQASVTRRARPVRRNTNVLSNVRSIFSYLSKKWGTLSLADRQMWTDYAAAHPVPNGMGGTFQLDGNQYFMKLNHTCIRIFGEAGEKTQPPVGEPPAVIDTLIAVGGAASGEIVIEYTQLGTPLATDANEVQFAGPFNSPGRVSVGSRFRYNQDKAGDVLIATLTGCQPGANYWVRVRYISEDGQVSNWVYDQAVAAA